MISFDRARKDQMAAIIRRHNRGIYGGDEEWRTYTFLLYVSEQQDRFDQYCFLVVVARSALVVAGLYLLHFLKPPHHYVLESDQDVVRVGVYSFLWDYWIGILGFFATFWLCSAPIKRYVQLRLFPDIRSGTLQCFTAVVVGALLGVAVCLSPLSFVDPSELEAERNHIRAFLNELTPELDKQILNGHSSFNLLHTNLQIMLLGVASATASEICEGWLNAHVERQEPFPPNYPWPVAEEPHTA